MYIRQRAVVLGMWLVAEMPLRVLLWLGNGIAITHLSAQELQKACAKLTH